MTSPSLFDGQTFERAKDGARLTGQLAAVRAIMADGVWWSLPELRAHTGYPEASISARLRDLRKARFGSHAIERRRRGPGLYEYRMGDLP